MVAALPGVDPGIHKPGAAGSRRELRRYWVFRPPSGLGFPIAGHSRLWGDALVDRFSRRQRERVVSAE
jgi:hypothetical protein